MIFGMAEVADVLATFLQSQSIGTLGTSIFVDFMPDAASELVAIYTVPGSGASYTMNKERLLTLGRIQVFTRGQPRDYTGPRLKARSVALLFDPIVGVTLSGLYIAAMESTDDPHLIARDEKERCVFSQYWEVTHERTQYSGAPVVYDTGTPVVYG